MLFLQISTKHKLTVHGGMYVCYEIERKWENRTKKGLTEQRKLKSKHFLFLITIMARSGFANRVRTWKMPQIAAAVADGRTYSMGGTIWISALFGAFVKGFPSAANSRAMALG